MESPEYYLNQEIKIQKIDLKDGETGYFDGKKYQIGIDSSFQYPYAKAGTFIVGKNGPTLEAWGGNCAVISLYEDSNKVGVLVHIDVIYIADKEHTEGIIDKMLLVSEGILSNTTKVNVFLDIEDNKELPETMKDWHKIILDKLQKNFSNINSFTKGNGKDVYLQTLDGKLKVFDDSRNLIYSNK